MTGAGVWIEGARPRTLGASIVPVLVGTAAAGHASVWRTIGALVVALGMQIGVNYANDYFDGVRGVDSAARPGPRRLTASGIAAPRSVARASAISLAVAAAAGLVLAIAADALWLVGVGAAAIAAAVLYSGGPRPYGGMALGELSVFAFFGVFATVGTAYVQAGRVSATAWWAAAPVGLLAVAILVVNNLRDIPSDAAAEKRTLAVRIGDQPTRILYGFLVVASYVVVVIGTLAEALSARALFTLATVPLAVLAMRTVRTASGRELVAALLGTARLHLAFGLALAIGLWLG